MARLKLDPTDDTVVLTLRLPARVVAGIDRHRGQEKRAEFVRGLLVRRFAPEPAPGRSSDVTPIPKSSTR